MFVGFNTTFLIMHWTGLLGMPQRVYTYEADPGSDTWINAALLLLSLLSVGLLLYLAYRYQQAGRGDAGQEGAPRQLIVCIRVRPKPAIWNMRSGLVG